MADGDVFGRVVAEGVAHEAPVPSITYATDTLPADRQFAAWRDRCSSVIGLSQPALDTQGFDARNTMWTLGDMALSHVRVPASGFARGKTMVRRDSLDHWMLGCLRRGRITTRVGDDVFTATAGDVCHTSLGEAFDGDRTECEWLVVFIPRDGLREWAPNLDATRNTPSRTPLTALFHDYLGLLERRLPTMTEADVPALIASTRAMIGACLGSGQGRNERTLAQLDAMRGERVRQIVQDNLRIPTFGPKKLGRLAGMSRSQLYRLFEPEGGVVRYIQRQRLRATHAALIEPANPASIASISEDFGFSDASTFSRAFRSEFGYRPSDARAAGLCGAGLDMRLTRQLQGDAPDFAGLLRRLRR